MTRGSRVRAVARDRRRRPGIVERGSARGQGQGDDAPGARQQPGGVEPLGPLDAQPGHPGLGPAREHAVERPQRSPRSTEESKTLPSSNFPV